MEYHWAGSVFENQRASPFILELTPSKSYRRKLNYTPAMKEIYHLICTTFVEMITQCSGNQGWKYIVIRYCKYNWTIWYQNHSTHTLFTLEIFLFPLAILPREGKDFLKRLNYIYSKWSKTQNYFSSSSRLGSLTLNPTTFKNLYLSTVASEASGGRILSVNQLHNFKKSPFINQQYFSVKKKNRWNSEIRQSSIHIFKKSLEENNFFFLNLLEEKYIIVGWTKDKEYGFAIRFVRLFFCKLV